MESSAASDSELAPSANAPPVGIGATARVPWFISTVIFGATCILYGIIWDISWHSTIGRDTFWTPAHLLIHLGGSLAGFCCGWLVLKTTFRGTSEERAASVRVWGFRGPLGAWVTIWGALAMIASAPFDNWWHDAYGLDVKILSPPHSVLAAGMYFVVVGVLLLVVSLQNRSAGTSRAAGGKLFVYAGGIILAMATIMVTELSLPNLQHAALYYQVSCPLYVSLMVTFARASKLRFPATAAAAIYMGLMLAMMWLLPLFAATPKLAPIYNPVTRMVPEAFPHWLILPAVAMDLLLLALGRGRGWRRDLLLVGTMNTAFVALFVPVQWFFSKFYLSPTADNWFFGGSRYWSYMAQPGQWRQQFWETQTDPLTVKSLAIAWLLALLGALIGLAWGNWMAKVKR